MARALHPRGGAAASTTHRQRRFGAAPALALALLLAAVTAGCGKVAEKAAEKAIESEIAKDGGSAKVDLSQGSAKVTSTDAEGRTTQAQLGGAQVTEADLGVPFYPGSKPQAAGASRVEGPDGRVVTLQLQTGDSPEKVAAFYRDKLKGGAAGKTFMEMAGGPDQITLMGADEKSGSGVQVHISKGDAGSQVQIIASQRSKGP